jgi:hypothetical protein
MAWKAVVAMLCAAHAQEQCLECSLTLTQLDRNNLGGLGPDGGPQEMRFGRVCTVQNQVLDLVLTTSSPYRSRAQNAGGRNGLFGHTGRIEVGLGSSVSVRFAFVRSGTDQFMMVRSVVITILDLDVSPEGFPETLFVSSSSQQPVDDFRAADTTVMRVPIVGEVMYTSTVPFVPNPSDPLNLTAIQQRNAVSFFYTHVSFVTVVFVATGPVDTAQARGFHFAGMSSLNHPCPTPSPTPPPTPLPTPQPTPSPTTQPTPSPTPQPSQSPTLQPTAEPTPNQIPTKPEFTPIKCRSRRGARKCPVKRKCAAEPRNQVQDDSRSDQQLGE